MANPISLVVPLYSDSRTYVNRLPLQRKQWISLKNQTDPNFEIIGGDNASYDNVTGLLKEYFPKAITFRHEAANNRAGVRFEAAKRANTPHVVVLDSDCVVYPHYIENWKKFFSAKPGCSGVGGFYGYIKYIFAEREFIIGAPPQERLDYAAFERFTQANHSNSRPCYPIPPSVDQEDRKGMQTELYNWSGGFYYSNAGFPKDLFLRMAAPEAAMTGYGHEDSAFGIRLRVSKTPVFFVRGVPTIHQCHRGPDNGRSHFKDCAEAKKNEEVLARVWKDVEKK